MNALDPFALGGRQDGDEEILALFRQWIELQREFDAVCGNADQEEAIEAREGEIEDAIIAASGPVALAVQIFLYLRHEFSAWAPAPYIRDFVDTEPNSTEMGLLRAAGKIVPQIAELSAAIIHDDAALIAADMEVTWARKVLGDPPKMLHYEEWLSETKAKLAAALDRMRTTEAKTERGEEIKKRHGLVVERCTRALYRKEGAS